MVRLTFFLRCTSTKVRCTQIFIYNSTGKVTYWKAELRFKLKTSQDKWNKNKIEFKCFKGVKLNISWLNVLWTILHCSHMPLGWPSPVVWPSWSLASAKPADHTLSSINIFQTWPLYTDSYQIFHCVWTKGCSSAPPHTVSERRDALVQCFSNFKLKSLSS